VRGGERALREQVLRDRAQGLALKTMPGPPGATPWGARVRLGEGFTVTPKPCEGAVVDPPRTTPGPPAEGAQAPLAGDVEAFQGTPTVGAGAGA
jgi:hypothetical protein